MCVRARARVFLVSFYLYLKRLSHIIHSFIHSYCLSQLVSRCYYEHTAKYYWFSSWFHHHIKSYGAFAVNRAAMLLCSSALTTIMCAAASAPNKRWKSEWICAHILFTFQWLCVIAHDTSRTQQTHAYPSLCPFLSDKNHFDTARKIHNNLKQHTSSVRILPAALVNREKKKGRTAHQHSLWPAHTHTSTYHKMLTTAWQWN